MKLFGFKQKPKGYLGVDIGACGVKVVQLNPGAGGKAMLFTYGFAERAAGEAPLSVLEHSDEVGKLLKEVCGKARTTTSAAIGALPIPQVFSSVVNIAPAEKKELKAVVDREAKKLLPRPLEEMALDFKELPPVAVKGTAQVSETQKTIEVLLTAAPKDIVDKYRALLADAGLVPVSLETEAFALIRALLGSDPTPTVIVDIGGVRSNIILTDRGIPVLTRSVEVGGGRCTEAIATSLKVPPARAEELKRDLGEGKLPQACGNIFEPLLNELKNTIAVYKTGNTSGRQIERIVLTGGGALLGGLTEFFSAQFRVRAFIGNPWEQVATHSDLKPILANLGPRLAVAVGLALRKI